MQFLEKLKSFFSSSSSTSSTGKPSRREQQQDGEEGILRYFNRSRGYGFIHRADSKEKVFVHVSDLKDKVRVGDAVTFETETTDKGPRAREVTLQD